MNTPSNRDTSIGRLAALLQPLDGLEVTDAERAVLTWLAAWEAPTVAALAALLNRARQAEPSQRVTR